MQEEEGKEEDSALLGLYKYSHMVIFLPLLLLLLLPHADSPAYCPETTGSSLPDSCILFCLLARRGGAAGCDSRLTRAVGGRSNVSLTPAHIHMQQTGSFVVVFFSPPSEKSLGWGERGTGQMSFSICLLISSITVNPQCLDPTGVSLSLFNLTHILTGFIWR